MLRRRLGERLTCVPNIFARDKAFQAKGSQYVHNCEIVSGKLVLCVESATVVVCLTLSCLYMITNYYRAVH